MKRLVYRDVIYSCNKTPHMCYKLCKPCAEIQRMGINNKSEELFTQNEFGAVL